MKLIDRIEAVAMPKSMRSEKVSNSRELRHAWKRCHMAGPPRHFALIVKKERPDFCFRYRGRTFVLPQNGTCASAVIGVSVSIACSCCSCQQCNRCCRGGWAARRWSQRPESSSWASTAALKVPRRSCMMRRRSACWAQAHA